MLSDLPHEVEDRLAALDEKLPDEAVGVLATVLASAPSYAFDAGPIRVTTDTRWFSTVPDRSPGSPMLVLRRWPGDSALALYALQGAERTAEDGAPPVEGSVFHHLGTDESGVGWWDGEIRSNLGVHPARWAERPVGETPYRLGALLLPGDAGLGREGSADLLLELQFVFSGVEFRPDRWAHAGAVGPETPVLPPVLTTPPGPMDEGVDPWLTAKGAGFTLGLPPGLRVRRAGGGTAAPRQVPGGLLWFRGRFTDRDGKAVVLGDPLRSGYLAEIPDPVEGWTGGKDPPVGAPGATAIRVVPYDLGEETGAASSTAGRWREEGFAGEWLVFRLRFESRGVEIGLPMLAGRRSKAVFWIPMTYRAAGLPPAPPPVDPAERFGIRFERFTGEDRRNRPWTEGYLVVPGLRAELPRGWFPVASLRSRDGFPVGIVTPEGERAGQLRRISPGDPVLEETSAGDWEPVGKPSRNRAEAVYRSTGGSVLYLGRAGTGFLLTPETAEMAAGNEWKRLTEGIQLVRGKS